MRRVRTALAIFATLGAMMLAASPAHAQEAQTFQADLAPLNNSGSSGRATVTVTGSTVTVNIESRGVSDGLPHAQHIHIGGTNTCPTPTAAGEDNLIDTAEGQPSYGAVEVSLTTEGDVGADSALAVERFPVATNGGTLNYQRTFELPEGVTVEDVRKGVIVQHGISKVFGDEAQYDGEPRSSLSQDLPLEATIPTNCGKLVASAQQGGQGQVAQQPRGGVAAGAGGTAGSGGLSPLVAVAAGVALIGGTATAVVAGWRLGRVG